PAGLPFLRDSTKAAGIIAESRRTASTGTAPGPEPRPEPPGPPCHQSRRPERAGREAPIGAAPAYGEGLRQRVTGTLRSFILPLTCACAPHSAVRQVINKAAWTRPIKGTSGRALTTSADLIKEIDLWITSEELMIIIGGDAVRSAAIGGEMTNHHRMRSHKLLLRKPYGLRYAVIAGIAAAGCCGLQLPAVATASTTAVRAAGPADLVATAGTTAARAAAAAGPVSPTPPKGLPKLAATGTTETVRQLVKCGSTMYAVGSFT